MASKTNESRFPGFFTDTKSADSARRQLIDAPLDASEQAAFGAGIEVAQFLSVLPEAFVRSQERELRRVQATAGPNDERIAFLQASIQQGEELRTTGRRGATRVRRVFGRASSNDEVFHGFVSDADLQPLSGVTVRLTSEPTVRGKLAATTDDDGYFIITLRSRSLSERGKATGEQPLSQKIRKLLEPRDLQSTIPAAEEKEQVTATVQISKKSKLLHEDPIPVVLNEGSIYREYVLNEGGVTKEKDFDDFVSGLSARSVDEAEKKP